MKEECSQPGCHNEARFTGVWLIPPGGSNRYGLWDRRPVCAPCTAADSPKAPQKIQALPAVQDAFVEKRKKAVDAAAKKLADSQVRLPGIAALG